MREKKHTHSRENKCKTKVWELDGEAKVLYVRHAITTTGAETELMPTLISMGSILLTFC